ncbi:MAG TPA: hypothetical protein VGM51_17725 [Armatimonadota bacterium]|jgi:hypothetical protein
MTSFAAMAVAALGLMAVLPAAAQKTPEGELILRSFANAPYPHRSRENGYTVNGKAFDAATHYSDSTVGIFIPAGLKPGEATDFVVHFHGHMNHVSQVFEEYNLRKEFVQSGMNAILLVPQGPKDATDSGDGHLELDAGGFEALLREVAAYLHGAGKLTTEKIGRVTLTAHSGGYNVTSAILQRGGLADNIRDVVLFDASYGNLEGFAEWAKRGHGRRLISLFTEHLASANVILMSMLQGRGVKYKVTLDGEWKDADLKARSVLFIHTLDLAHNDTVSKKDYFARFLAAGSTR